MRGRSLVAQIAAHAVIARAAIIHTHFLHLAHVSARASELARLPWSISLHGRDLLVEADQETMQLLRQARVAVVPSGFLADAAVDRGLSPDRIVIAPSGLGAEHFRPRRPSVTHEVVRLALIGRFVEKKGLDVLARALDEISQARQPTPRLHVRIVGYGPLKAEVCRWAAQWRNSISVEVLDGRSRSTVETIYDWTDLIISPSRTASDGDAETLCVVNLEAQARGIPVLTTRHGGILEDVSTESALIVEEDDASALAHGIGELATSPERWSAMGAAGRQYVTEHFCLQGCVERFERALIDAVSSAS